MIFTGNGKQKKKVFVGVSGGVDSSVSAALLRDQGYDVVGVFIRTWQPDWTPCTWRDERRDAMRVCTHLKIPFVELNLEEEYKKGVADYMIREYAAGRTPNPDVMCNREVKFGGFLKWAIENGAGFVATGHYARIENEESRIKNKEYSHFSLLTSLDPAKDQSYFLWTLTSDQLSRILFPIGHLQKSEVRKLAQKYNLPTAAKKDSQGICFIGEIDMKEFLAHYLKPEQGNVLDEPGKIIGTHDGALLYTLGERHGFTITSKGTHDLPYYVVAKDVANNTITVSQVPTKFETSREIILTDCVFREVLKFEQKYSAQIRYHGKLKSCTISQKNETECEIVFDEPDYSLSPGQSVVIYDGEICIGGGIVK